MSVRIDAVLLDLDGTLADTAPDLASALNRLRQERGLEQLPYAVIRPVASQGGAALVRLAFPDIDDETELQRLRDRFLALYADALHVDGQLFPGMDDVLRQLGRHGTRWGIVTNKPAWLAAPLIEALSLTGKSGCLVCGDQVARPKPDPDAVLEACRQLQVSPQYTVFAGDARRDIEAGRAAGTWTLAARWGYLVAGDAPEHWSADAVIESPGAILDWIEAVSV